MDRELEVYREYYEAENAFEAAMDPSTDNRNYLAAAERFVAAKEAVRKLRNEKKD